MKILVVLFSLFFSVNAWAQIKDSVYISKQHKLVLKSAPNVADRSLITIDGKIYNGKLEDIDTTAIDNFDVMKPIDAANVFGPAAKNGALMFTMINPDRLKIATDRFKSLREFILLNKPLVIINHVPYKGSVESISAYAIQNVDVLNDKEATARFGISAKNGAVLISTSQKIDNVSGLLK